jgi:hypothetical protein
MPIDSDQIKTNAAAPRRVAGDQGSAEQHSIPDQIAADEYGKQDDLLESVQQKKRFPILFSKARPTWPS